MLLCALTILIIVITRVWHANIWPTTAMCTCVAIVTPPLDVLTLVWPARPMDPPSPIHFAYKTQNDNLEEVGVGLAGHINWC